MSAELLFNLIAAGLLTGAVYGLMALGLSAIFGVMRVVNFAHGEMMVLGMFAAWTASERFGLTPLVALPIVAAGMFFAGYALQRGLINRFIAAPEHMQFLLLVAVAIILTNGSLLAYGPDARGVQLDAAFESYSVGFLNLDKVRVMAALGAVAGAVLFWLFFRFTLTGKAIRACADNLTGAQVIGLNVKRLYAFTFGLGAASVGAAGCLMLLVVDVHPHLAADYTLLAFTIVIIGGLGSLAGALLGGILVGLTEALAGFLIMPSLKSLFSFGLLILILLLRPQGLMGRRS